MNETCWEEVIAALLALLEEISPDVRELVTPPQRLAAGAGTAAAGAASGGSGSAPVSPLAAAAGGRSGGVTEITPAAGGGGGASAAPSLAAEGLHSAPSVSAAGGGGGGRAFSLREGVGARRLAKFRCQAATQLLLVQGCSEVYAKAARVGRGGAREETRVKRPHALPRSGLHSQPPARWHMVPIGQHLLCTVQEAISPQ